MNGVWDEGAEHTFNVLTRDGCEVFGRVYRRGFSTGGNAQAYRYVYELRARGGNGRHVPLNAPAWGVSNAQADTEEEARDAAVALVARELLSGFLIERDKLVEWYTERR